MKTLKFILVAGLALAASAAARASTAQAWLETYYLNPQPEQLTQNIIALSREGYFDKQANIATSIGFISTVFAQNPTRVDGWMSELSRLPEREQRLLAAALWQSGNARGAQALRELSQNSAVRADVERLANKPSQAIENTPVRSASSMNLKWGAFLATGNESHVVSILEAIGTNQPGVDSAARRSLAYNAAAHPRVLEICRSQLDRQPAEVQSVLRAALNDAGAQPRS